MERISKGKDDTGTYGYNISGTRAGAPSWNLPSSAPQNATAEGQTLFVYFVVGARRGHQHSIQTQLREHHATTGV